MTDSSDIYQAVSVSNPVYHSPFAHADAPEVAGTLQLYESGRTWGFAASSSICLRMRRATWGSRFCNSVRADRAKTTAESATRLTLGAGLDKASYSCERFTTIPAPGVG